MRKLTIILSCILFATMLFAGCADKKEEKAAVPVTKKEVNVSAAASMKDALTEAQKIFQQKNSAVELIFNFGASGALQKQIEQGAPADLFISAAPKQMNELQDKNLIRKETRKDLVENKLVIVTPKDAKIDIAKVEDIAKDGVKKFAMGEPASVPAGQYAKQTLENLNLWEKVQGKAVMAKDVRAVLAYVETGNVDAGFVYKTDAVISDKVRIAVEAPAGSHKQIVYPAALLAGAKQPKEAEAFLDFLMSQEGKTILEKYGFTPMKK